MNEIPVIGHTGLPLLHAGSPVYAPPGPLRNPRAPHHSPLESLASRLPVVSAPYEPRAPLSAEQLALQQAFESLVSAACYLSLTSAGSPASTLAAVQLLHDLAQQVHEEMDVETLERGSAAGLTEDTVWRREELKWRRHHSIELAIRFVKSSAVTRFIDTGESRRKKHRGWLTNLWSARLLP